MNHKFSYNWKLSDGYPAKGIDYHGAKVFGTFICGGGSTMGYKLAGYDHLGGVEIDPEVANVYKLNHLPKHLYNEDIRSFRVRNDLPDELFSLDLLDGSPPCSSFSMAGNRDNDWGKKKQFREGQTEQILDDLFFEYIALAKRLQPKVVIAENVKGLIQGNAKAYVKKINDAFIDAGYKAQLFLLNAASMGVPQKRERVFFIAQRNDLKLPKLQLDFNEVPVLFKIIKELALPENGKVEWLKLTDHQLILWKKCKQGESFSKHSENGSGFNDIKLKDDDVCNTISAQQHKIYHSTEPRHLHKSEFCAIGSYPQDYNFLENKYGYLIGMSVPPVMMAQIAHQIYLQWIINK